MTGTESDYDEIIAPMLHRGRQALHRSGHEPHRPRRVGAGREWHYPIDIGPDAGIGQKLAQLAAHSHGNIDLLCIEVMKRFDCSQSIVLSPFKSLEEGT